MTIPSVHPLGNKAKVLLSSVFGPYGQDDDYGSRKINPMELYQNQVTRVQGSFSLRMFHRSFGLKFIQANLKAPCTLLDFPTLDRFKREITEKAYDVIGIGAIFPNLFKVKTMCELIRQIQPQAVIVIGGHIAGKKNLDHLIDADFIVRGDGVKWLRQYLGEDPTNKIHHPLAYSAFGTHIVGSTLRDKPGDTAAILIPSVGCPVGCNFCSTSALFGGKGKFINFYETGDELFEVMQDIEKQLKVRSFFILDENFLLHRKRALRLLELMQQHNKSWVLMVFSSARVIRSYTIDQIVSLGIGWVWMGIEGQSSQYRKLQDVDVHTLVTELQSHGIRVLGSSIIGLETHTPDNIDAVIDYAISHHTDFHQFMLYTPNPGTPLYEKHKQAGTLLDSTAFAPSDAHGQYRFSYRHHHIQNGREGEYLLEAFKRDFKVNGPSLARLIRTHLSGWQRYKNHPDPRIRSRYDFEVDPLRSTYAGAVWAMRRYYRHDPRLFKIMDRLLKDIWNTFGLKTKLKSLFYGPIIFFRILQEEKRLANGWRYEPDCFYEKNAAAKALEQSSRLSNRRSVSQRVDPRLIPQASLVKH